jgi:hypothetical protein
MILQASGSYQSCLSFVAPNCRSAPDFMRKPFRLKQCCTVLQRPAAWLSLLLLFFFSLKNRTRFIHDMTREHHRSVSCLSMTNPFQWFPPRVFLSGGSLSLKLKTSLARGYSVLEAASIGRVPETIGATLYI